MYNSVCFIILSWVFAVLVFPGNDDYYTITGGCQVAKGELAAPCKDTVQV